MTPVRTRSLATIGALCAAAALSLPGAALAKGGSPAPAPSAPGVYCDWTLDGPTADGGDVFSNQAGDAGCLSVKQLNGRLSLYGVTLTPGWTYEVVSNGEGTDSTVRVKFTETATGRRVDARVEFGRTYIK